MKNFLRALEAHKWEALGIVFITLGSECLRIAGFKAKEQMDVWQEANTIAKNSSGE